MKIRILIPRPLLTTLLIFGAFTGSLQGAEISVTTTNDSGAGSLREAIANAGPDDTITFSLPANSAITLTSGELLTKKNVTIIGPGANLLTVQRSTEAGIPNFRIFHLASTSNTVAISGLTITHGNTFGASGDGAGILNIGTLILTNVTISDNTAGGGVGGAGISNSDTGDVTITNSTISGNLEGGGISNRGMLTIINSTISGNTATGGGGIGGGIETEAGTVNITNSTISDNSASSVGGGISRDSSSPVNAKNTIIALNTAPNGADVFNGLTSQGYNLIGKTGGSVTPTTGDQIGPAIDPKLGPLKDNGGPTKTHALLSGSPAIDKGNSSGSANDQRGLARPVDDPTFDNASGGDGSDIGAYEVQSDLLPGCNNINRIVTNKNDSGAGSLRGVIASVCAGSTITFAADVRGAIDLTSGELLLDKFLTISGPGANLLTVQRSAASGTGDFRIFNITPASVNATISGLTIANGKVTSLNFGGGTSNAGTLTLTSAAVVSSTAFAGGGIFNNGTLTLTNTTIAGNTAGSGGSGITNSGGTMTITNTTISDNMAGSGNGGGITNNGTTTLTNSTIAGNSAPGDGAAGGGVHNFSGTMRVRNTIIALNTSPNGPDFNGQLTSQGFNLIGNKTDATIAPAQFSDQLGTAGSPIDPLLGALQDNGGPTLTRALLTGSSAIDKGHSSGSATDQRGFARPADLADIDNVNGGDGGDIGAFEVPLPGATPIPTPTPTATPGLVGNVSTRLPVGTDDNVLIEGFIVQGPAGSTKKIIVRAIGPSLIPFGITDALANPILEIHDADNAIVASNDDWRVTQVGGLITADQSAEIAASGFAPGNDLESAIIADLAPGSYTAVVRGFGNSVGTGVVDAFDLSASSSARLANIATRGLIQPGDKLMIAGFIVQNAPVRAVVRAIGPSLAAFGITNALPDTTLQLRDQNGAIVVENDDWKVRSDGSSQQAELEATSLQPTDDLEAAFVTDLQPGQYTAQVRGKPETTGIGVVQVYFLQ